jgi:hypothetical protein
MVDKELKVSPATLVTATEEVVDEEVVAEDVVKEAKPKVKVKSKPKPKYEYYVSGEAAIELAGIKFLPGDVVTVRPIPGYYFASHISRRRVN